MGRGVGAALCTVAVARASVEWPAASTTTRNVYTPSASARVSQRKSTPSVTGAEIGGLMRSQYVGSAPWPISMT